MKYVYENISGSDAVSLVRGKSIRGDSSEPLGSILINKCRIANTYSAAITVDVYIYAIDRRGTELLYGDETQDEDDQRNVYVTKEYYFIKDMVIPTGAAVNVFSDGSCTFTNEYTLKIQLGTSNDTADVAVDYEISQGTTTTTTGRRTLNQY